MVRPSVPITAAKVLAPRQETTELDATAARECDQWLRQHFFEKRAETRDRGFPCRHRRRLYPRSSQACQASYRGPCPSAGLPGRRGTDLAVPSGYCRLVFPVEGSITLQKDAVFQREQAHCACSLRKRIAHVFVLIERLGSTNLGEDCSLPRRLRKAPQPASVHERNAGVRWRRPRSGRDLGGSKMLSSPGPWSGSRPSWQSKTRIDVRMISCSIVRGPKRRPPPSRTRRASSSKLEWHPPPSI